MKKSKIKHWLILLVAVLAVVLVAAACGGWYVKSMIRDNFKLNAKLKSEGYYLAEFEFKMLGCAWWLDHGEYFKALAAIYKMHRQLESRDGLVKIPEFRTTSEKLEFYKNLQNPQTGSFISGADYPLFCGIGVTANMISFIEELSREAQQPFALKYRLNFLDKIAAPQDLYSFLDDLSTIGWIGARFKSPYVAIGELRELAQQVCDLRLYSFSPQWHDAFLSWCYTNQDSETGFWGVRNRGDNRLIDGGNITDSEKMLKVFVNFQGEDIYPRYPLRYIPQMFKTALAKISGPLPTEPDKQHEWVLDNERGVRFFTRYLWPRLGAAEKTQAAALFHRYVTIRFERFYCVKDGAFSLYPDAACADLDGTGEAIGMFSNIGALQPDKQRQLWGDADTTIGKSKIVTVAKFEPQAVSEIIDDKINSLRIYGNFDKNYPLRGVTAVCYPRKTSVLDVCDVLPKIISWAGKTTQDMGNWVFREGLFDIGGKDVRKEFSVVPVFQQAYPENIGKQLAERGEITIVGFDVLQVPRSSITFKKAADENF